MNAGVTGEERRKLRVRCKANPKAKKCFLRETIVAKI